MMTPFQKYCKENPRVLLNETFALFCSYNPGLSAKELKLKFAKEINELFFKKLR